MFAMVWPWGARSRPRTTPFGLTRPTAVEKNKKLLADFGIRNHILSKAGRFKPPTKAQKDHNSFHAKIPCQIEKVFFYLKGTQGLGRTRYLGIQKNTAWALMTIFAYNLKRAAKIYAKEAAYA